MERKLKSRRSEIFSQQLTSLASPSQPSPKLFRPGMSSDKKNSTATRNPAQLSLRKNGASSGGVNSQHSFGSFQGFPSSTKVNGFDLGNPSSNSTRAWRTSVRLPMSPAASTNRSGPRILPQRSPLGFDFSHLPIVGALAGWPDDLNLQHRSAVSETTRSAPTRASADRSGKSRANSRTPQSVRTNILSGPVAGQHSLRNGQSQKRSLVKSGTQMVQQSTSGRLGSTHVDRGFAQQAQTSQRREPGRSISANSFTNRQSAKKPPEMTIERAVDLLDIPNQKELLISAAAYIQSQCFRKDEAKVAVRSKEGAKKLVLLLKNDDEEVQRAAAAALRNVVYKNGDNKKDVTNENGLTIILNLLDKTHDKETVCQLAGVLWNLSSVDEIKDLFNENFLNVLTKVILVPFSHINGEAESKRDLIADPNAFLCATACLRNLSSDDNHRKNMRSCENLIDSLASYTMEAASKRTPDDQLTENCVCILQNLTYEAEVDWISQAAKNKVQIRKNKEETQQSTTPKESRTNLGEDAKDKEEAEILQYKEDPFGVKWLWSGQLVRVYLSLLACSTNKMTLQAAMGALQNLTVRKGEISESVVRIITEEKGPLKIATILEKDITLKKPAFLLMRNLSRFPELHSSIFHNLVATEPTKSLLYHLDISAQESAKLMPILCRILINLSKNRNMATWLSSETAVNDMLQKKYKGKAEEAVKELRDTLSRANKHLKEDKTKNRQNYLQLLPKFLQCHNGAKHEEIPSTI